MDKGGDIVLIQDDMPRVCWRMGEVEQLIKSHDGYVRACKLRVYTKNRRVGRSINYVTLTNHKELLFFIYKKQVGSVENYTSQIYALYRRFLLHVH